MDILKKLFGLNQNQEEIENNNQPKVKDEFRKPIWIEDYETDDDLIENNKPLSLQIFSNPLELQKHFEQQINEMMKAFEENDDFIKSGYENENMMKKFDNFRELSDNDLDGEKYSDQLNYLLQRISPELKTFLSQAEIPREYIKRTEEESIMDRIHGTYSEPEQSTPTRKRISKLPVHPNNSSVFDGGNFQSPKIFGQSIITQTIRKPDGSQETRRFTKDSHGNTETTITKMVDGKETVTTYGSKSKERNVFEGAPSLSSNHELNPTIKPQNPILDSERNVTITKFGYILPKNLW